VRSGADTRPATLVLRIRRVQNVEWSTTGKLPSPMEGGFRQAVVAYCFSRFCRFSGWSVFGGASFGSGFHVDALAGAEGFTPKSHT
jgi:hypothetical protein